MKVYFKNLQGEQTVRDLPFFTALWLRWKLFFRYNAEERPTMRFMF